MAVRNFNETTEIKEIPSVLDLAPAADSLDDIFVAPDVAGDGVAFIQTGREVVTVKNTDVGAQTFTIKSVADELKRTGDIGPYSLAAGESATFSLPPKGFKNVSTNRVTIIMSVVGVEVAVNRIRNLTQ